ncbi:hypothetical protein MA03_06965 [Infirmifilum uzonense]|uniref:Uncharacterized protein n=1 Tax=Infirmifilum uzonense TaxID=1550241 RepID=A0A0F7CL97_9CREN|nr:KEOPS complex subunit Pcc1 [Infirmifilum uzonense]AKG39031.1 hypothetical protein MA03_06965 [Infirmifilum uzonense]
MKHHAYKGCIYVYGDDSLVNVFKALQPETLGTRRYKSKSSVEYEGEMLQVCIEAERLSSFRAAFNTFLRLLSMIVELETPD